MTNLWFFSPHIDTEVQRRTDGPLRSSASMGLGKEHRVSTWVCSWGCPSFFYWWIVKNSVIVILYWVLQSGHTNLCLLLLSNSLCKSWDMILSPSKRLPLKYRAKSVPTLNSHAKSHAEHPDSHTSRVEVSMLSETWLADFTLFNLLENLSFGKRLLHLYLACLYLLCLLYG